MQEKLSSFERKFARSYLARPELAEGGAMRGESVLDRS